MQGHFQRGGAYPISVVPRGDQFEVVNLQTSESHGLFASPSAAADKQDEVSDALRAKVRGDDEQAAAII